MRNTLTFTIKLSPDDAERIATALNLEAERAMKQAQLTDYEGRSPHHLLEYIYATAKMYKALSKLTENVPDGRYYPIPCVSDGEDE